MTHNPFPPHAILPFSIQPCMADHGDTSVIVDAQGFVVAKIASPAWNDEALLKYPQDRANAALILHAVNSLYPMKAALKALYELVLLERRATSELNPDIRWQYLEQVNATLDEAARLLQTSSAWEDEAVFSSPQSDHVAGGGECVRLYSR